MDLKEWILKRFESLKMTDEERRELWDLPEGVQIREFARLVPHDKWKRNLKIGKYVYIGEGCIIDCSERVSIGDFTSIAAYSQVYTHSTINNVTSGGEIIKKPVCIGEHTWIGSLVTIYPGVNIGERVVVMPNSVVNIDLPDNTAWGGIPVERIKSLEKN
jgi:acetyltransferase-like isoleucine patch superfamily enzyme